MLNAELDHKMCNKAYPVAFVKTHINDAFEENEIGFGEFKSLELGSKQIAIFGQKVLKQNGVHSASANKNKHLIYRFFSIFTPLG